MLNGFSLPLSIMDLNMIRRGVSSGWNASQENRNAIVELIDATARDPNAGAKHRRKAADILVRMHRADLEAVIVESQSGQP